ncbi:DUF7269 family protein [Halosimplex salinum]|uniref:DUF7269 family protein n=1 Tax=Halosimplex salinum TaxID=1710538 RepID=UPI000F4871BC|nr:hypothetical protein [Halosimplex salinum]
MNPVLLVLVITFGVLAIGAALALAVVLTPVTATGAGEGAVLVALAGVALALAKLYGPAPDRETVEPPPWTEEGALVAGRPEETTEPADVTGDELAALLDEACDRARGAETVEDGFIVVRPALAAVVERVLVASGTEPDAVEDALANGSWTDDPVAAAVVDERVQRPRSSVRERVPTWLFPERTVRRETARTVAAIEAMADERLPPVPGQRAPRTAPTLEPAIGSLQRTVDGTLQPASAAPAPGRDGEGYTGTTGRTGDESADGGDDSDGEDSEDDLFDGVWADA